MKQLRCTAMFILLLGVLFMAAGCVSHQVLKPDVANAKPNYELINALIKESYSRWSNGHLAGADTNGLTVIRTIGSETSSEYRTTRTTYYGSATTYKWTDISDVRVSSGGAVCCLTAGILSPTLITYVDLSFSDGNLERLSVQDTDHPCAIIFPFWLFYMRVPVDKANEYASMIRTIMEVHQAPRDTLY